MNRTITADRRYLSLVVRCPRIVSFVSWFVFATATALLFLAVWIVLPGWTGALLVLSVGAPEYSPWLLLCSVIVCVLAMTISGSSRLLQLTVVVALLSAVLASIPLLQVPSAVRQFDTEMRRALGEDFLAGVPAAVHRGMRGRPVVLSDLLRGIDFGEGRVAHGIPFAVAGGKRLTLSIYRPNGEGRFPTVVQIYGSRWQRGSSDDNPEFARYLATKGYVVFAIDYRHAPRWTWPAQMADVRAALGWIREHAAEHDADVSRLAVMGRSAGAHLALLSAYEPDAPAVRGVVSYYGPVDLEEGYRRPPRPDPLDVRAILEAFLSGPPGSAATRYRDASPISYVTRPLPPALLIYGARDHVVEPRFGRMLHERLLATGTTSVLLEIPWAGHAFDALPSGLSAQIALYYTERFLAWALMR